MARKINADRYDAGMDRIQGIEKARYVVYFAEESGDWWRVTRREVELLGEMLDDPQVTDAYSLWCTRTGQLMERGPR